MAGGERGALPHPCLRGLGQTGCTHSPPRLREEAGGGYPMPFVSLSLSHRDAVPSWPEMMALAQDDAGALCFLICSPVCFPPCQLQIKQEEARGVPVIATLLGG